MKLNEEALQVMEKYGAHASQNGCLDDEKEE